MTTRKNEKGVALLSVLLVVAVMSVAAIAMLERTTGSIADSKVADTRTSLAWTVSGAEEAGRLAIERLRTTTQAQLTTRTPGLGVPFATEIDRSTILSALEDASNCFNLNALVPPEGMTDADPAALTAYENLLIATGFTETDAEELVASLVDWVDPDSSARLGGAENNFYASLRPAYRTSGAPLVSVSELRAMKGYQQTIFTAIEPLVCARPQEQIGTLNINTLTLQQAPLLAMAFSGVLDVRDAVDIIASRPAAGWASIEAMLAHDRLQRISPDQYRLDLLSTRSSHILLRGRANQDTNELRFRTLYRLPDNQPVQIVRRTYGDM